MSGVELALGIAGAVGAIDLAIKACRRVAEICSTFSNAETEFYERRIRLLSNCRQIEQQLDLLNQVQKHLDQRSQELQYGIIDILTSKLQAVANKVERLSTTLYQGVTTENVAAKPPSILGRAKYTLSKSDLDKDIDDIESWQRVSFNPLWFTILKIQSEQIDEHLGSAKMKNTSQGNNNIVSEAIAVRGLSKAALSTHVFLSLGRLKHARTTEIALSSAKMIQIDGKWRLMDSLAMTSRDTAREIAAKLRSSNPARFGLLTCLGATYDETTAECNLVFRIPDKMSDGETLRTKLRARNSSHSLSEQFRLATQLARAVCSLHTFDIVHESIQPENIILFQDQESSLGSAFLLGFERARREQDMTHLIGDADWKRDIYRHPQRQGPKIQERFIMQHDIYSLGVCMLEIGLWRDFTVDGAMTLENDLPDSYDLSESELDNMSPAEFTKTILVCLATAELPQKMGTRYAKVVKSCLTCLDLGNEDFEEELESFDNGVLIAVRYIEKVLKQLNTILI